MVGDEDITTIVTPTTPAAIHTGPITRARARQLNYQVLSFLGNDFNVHEFRPEAILGAASPYYWARPM